MHSNQALKKETDLPAERPEMKAVGISSAAGRKAISFGLASELSPKEAFCCSRATD